jgi:hypothetical protein
MSDSSDEKEEYYEHVNYRELLKLQPDDFFLHLPIQLPFLKWFFEFRLEMLHMMNLRPNYFGMRHRLDPQSQWFSDWVFLIHYLYDYEYKKNWKPTLTDKIRFNWLMRQGYRREYNNYLELKARKEDKKVSAKERIFHDKYIDCTHSSYIDSYREDELAFFRMGIDADEQLDNEDKPLFPNIAYSYRDDPRLAYWTRDTMLTETIPEYPSWWNKRNAKKLMTKKWEKGEKVTYADMRIMFNPDTTKIHDIEFILHTYDKHDGPPIDIEEKKLYDAIWPVYTTEITHLGQMMHMPELEKMNFASPRKELNPLYVAYKQRWFNKNPVKNFEKVFHGVTQDEYQEIVNEQYKHFEKINRPKSKKRIDKSEIQKLNDLLKKISK